MVSENDQEFRVRPWDDSISHKDLLDIINETREYFGYGPMKQEVYDRVFASIPDPTKDMVIVENPNERIVGFAALHKPKLKKTLVCWDAVLPEFFTTAVTGIILQQAISLGRRRNLSNLKYVTMGPLCKPIDDALEKMEFTPDQIAVELHLTEFENQEFPDTQSKIPPNIEFSKNNKIINFDQYVSVFNEAYRGNFDYKELTIDDARQAEKHNRAMGELEYIFALAKNKIIGYCEPIYHSNNFSGTIMGLAVLPNYQNQGIGRGLLKMAIDILHQKGSKMVRLVVWVDAKTSLKLYSDLGFEKQEDLTRRVYDILSGKI